jgi:thymidylate synthase (FAD)
MEGRNGFHVLDHGMVALVESMGSDLSIVRNARVSYDAEWRGGFGEASDCRLINYLVKNNHTSPMEAVKFTFEVKAPIFVFRQWHRHRTWSYNEVSARYTELPEEFYVPDPELLGTQAAGNKQCRDLKGKTDNPGLLTMAMAVQCQAAFETYRFLLTNGVPRELARSVLPVSTYSRMFATVDLNNLMKFLKLRLHSHAQYEIRVYAEAMLVMARSVCPIAVAAFETHGGIKNE